MHWTRIRGHATSAGVRLRAKETEISAAPWAFGSGKDFLLTKLSDGRHIILMMTEQHSRESWLRWNGWQRLAADQFTTVATLTARKTGADDRIRSRVRSREWMTTSDLV